MTQEIIELQASIGPVVTTCPECGAPIRIHISTDELVEDVTNAATTATNLVNASNIVRRLLTSGQVPPEVLEDVQRSEALLTRATTRLVGGL